MEKAVAFLDLLAFSSRIRENTPEALMAFTNYRTILQTAWQDSQRHPVESYPEVLRELVARSGIDSFEHFLPFSDSIFIAGEDPSMFLMQLGHFVLNCFRFTARHYLQPEDRANPTQVTIPEIGRGPDGHLVAKETQMHYFPTLFRGGIAWGEAVPISLFGIVQRNPVEIANLAGKAVVEAVGLESKVKGPRIIFAKDFYERLNDAARVYVKETEIKGYFELLWPGFHYILSNGSRETNSFRDLFIPAVNLWRAHNHTASSEHYFRFVELVVMSTIKVFESAGMLQVSLQTIRQAITTAQLGDKMQALLKDYHRR
ncbi:MAG: hypothetical protein BGO55_01495 [Sphingobacteriales bacterium 50-39]|nr:hypothetical protein [Sphingobacteriales bacterium]OJW53780.1 MAG: hypothetical protein BGO55_01495 [Sphingobacteriales bacterium 50-39]